MPVNEYTRNGAIAGAATGALGAAILSWLKLRNSKSSRSKKILKGLLYSAAGALAGGGVGAYAGTMLGRHKAFSNAVDAANSGKGDGRGGRVFFVSAPNNRFRPREAEMPEWMGDAKGKFIDAMYGKDGRRIGHALVGTVDDNGAVKLYGIGTGGMRDAKYLASEVKGKLDESVALGGMKENSPEYLRELSRIKEIQRQGGSTFVGSVPLLSMDEFQGNPGMSTEEIAKMIEPLIRKYDWGDTIDITDGGSIRDVDALGRSLDSLVRDATSPGGGGYSFLPGGFNCGTAARDAFDSVLYGTRKGKASHFLNMLWGGRPDANEPSLFEKHRHVMS